MQNIKATGNKFLVEIKNGQGEYEPLGVLSFREATEIQFTTHHAIRMQRVSDIEERDGKPVGNAAPVGKQLFTRAELDGAIKKLAGLVCFDKRADELMGAHELHGVYYVDGEEAKPWPDPIMVSETECVAASVGRIGQRIRYGVLMVHFRPMDSLESAELRHGIRIKDGKIAEVF